MRLIIRQRAGHDPADPSLYRRNRFYGIAFSLLGIVLLIASTDRRFCELIVVATLGVLCAAEKARAMFWAIQQAPSPATIGNVCSDPLLPSLMYVRLRRSLS